MTDDLDPSIRRLFHDAARPANDAPAFDPAEAPSDPMPLVRAWFRSAVEAGVVQPQAATLSTATASEGPDARTVLIKDVDDAVWFATSNLSPKGQQIAADPRVVLTFYWREQGRQLRMHGHATPGPRDAARADFTSRHPDSRAVALALPQSTPLDDHDDALARLEAAKQFVFEDDDFAPDDWTLYRVDAQAVEFWQATTGRDQVRLRYERASVGEQWTSDELWP